MFCIVFYCNYFVLVCLDLFWFVLMSFLCLFLLCSLINIISTTNRLRNLNDQIRPKDATTYHTQHTINPPLFRIGKTRKQKHNKPGSPPPSVEQIDVGTRWPTAERRAKSAPETAQVRLDLGHEAPRGAEEALVLLFCSKCDTVSMCCLSVTQGHLRFSADFSLFYFFLLSPTCTHLSTWTC